MDLKLSNRVVLVVGGTGTIGSVIVATVAAEGATVIAASRSGSAPETVAGTVVPLELDASDDSSVTAAIQSVVDQHGRLDAVIITAAPAAHTLDPTRKSDPSQVAEAVAAKTLVFLRVANAAIPFMREAGYGRIVAINGQNAYLTGNVTNAVRNAALIVVAKNLADELAGTGVTVNTVNPGLVTETPSAEVAIGRGGDSTPQQVADLTAFLISPVSVTSGESIAIGHRSLGVTVL
jgi:NAD(P)-dependent dehydrogenase (short-subunit alcohol dehydrogenase family)